MPALPFVLFLTMPVIAALSLEFDTFVHLLILFCIVAGLSASSPERARRTPADAPEATAQRRVSRQPEGGRSGEPAGVREG